MSLRQQELMVSEGLQSGTDKKRPPFKSAVIQAERPSPELNVNCVRQVIEL
jgi:hypothetical protein